jgi:hypothetical protein
MLKWRRYPPERRKEMATMMEYFKEIMQQGVEEFDEEKENHSIEKKPVIKIYNIDNGWGLEITTNKNAMSIELFPVFLSDILGEVPELKENSDTKTTEIFLKRHQVEKIINILQERYEKELNVNYLQMINDFKEIA